MRRLRGKISASKFDQVDNELKKRCGTFLAKNRFTVPDTDPIELNFAFIKRDMAKLKKGIHTIVDDIIKDNEPPEEEPSPPKRGRQSSREPRSPPTPPTKTTPLREKTTLLHTKTAVPSSSEPRSPSTPPTKTTPLREKTTLQRAKTVAPSSSGPLPASSSSGPLPAKTRLTGSVPPPKTQSTEPPSKPATGVLAWLSKLRGNSERENIRQATQWVEETQQQALGRKTEAYEQSRVLEHNLSTPTAEQQVNITDVFEKAYDHLYQIWRDVAKTKGINTKADFKNLIKPIKEEGNRKDFATKTAVFARVNKHLLDNF